MVRVLTKVGCPRCMLLKDKLHRLGVEYQEVTERPPGVPDEAHVPLVEIGGRWVEYAEAIALLKGVK